MYLISESNHYVYAIFLLWIYTHLDCGLDICTLVWYRYSGWIFL